MLDKIGLNSLGVLVLLLMPWSINAQCHVEKDSHGQVTCEVYTPQIANSELVPSHKIARYLGSEFFSFPIWQKGTIQLDRLGPEISCRLAYNVVEQRVLCQMNNDAKSTELKPYSFTLNGIKFSQHLAKQGSIGNQPYTTILYDGATKLLKGIPINWFISRSATAMTKTNRLSVLTRKRSASTFRRGMPIQNE